MGGVATWLAGRSDIWSRLALTFERPLGARWLLQLAARLGDMTDPSTLGPLTQTTLTGATPAMAALLGRVADEIAGQRPEAVLLSNALLMGLVPALRQRLDAPILCTLQSEADFIEDLEAPWSEAVWSSLRQLVPSVDGFVAVSAAHGAEMAGHLGLDAGAIAIVPHGVEVGDTNRRCDDSTTPVIAYLARLDRRHGAERLLEAFSGLWEGRPEVRLRLAGSMSGQDRDFVTGLERRAAALGLEDRVEVTPNISPDAKRELLETSTLLCVPTEREAAGRYLFEAMAAGCPVVAPRVGALVEWIEDTGGGVLYDPEERGGLPGALEAMLDDPEGRAQAGLDGRDAVVARYQSHHMAEKIVAAIRTVRVGTGAGVVAQGEAHP
jgi:glycosyltransferase involved in cell wall biosynthesis